MLVIKELLFDRTRGQYVGERITRCPADVEIDSEASWLEQRYGPAFNTARTLDEDLGDVAVGWVYDVPADWPSANPDTQELVAMPMLVDDDGELTEAAFLVQAEQIRCWQDPAEQVGIEITVSKILHPASVQGAPRLALRVGDATKGGVLARFLTASCQSGVPVAGGLWRCCRRDAASMWVGVTDSGL